MRTVASFPRPVRTIEHVWIPMSDGCRLATRIWMPEDAEDHPVPAVLEYIPYRHRDMTRSRDTVMHHYVAGHGYACVRIDMRGSGNSEGVLTDEYLPREQEDALEALRWLAAQPWCTGRVGMVGKSWGGFNALQIASLRPPELGAVVAVCATDDRYSDDVHYMGGCLLGDNLSWASTMFAYNSCPPDPEIVGDAWRDMWFQRLEGSGLWVDRWLRHQRRDDYWRHGSVNEDYGAIRCPVMVVSGWADGYTNAVFRLIEHLDVPRRGLVGPWSHKYPHQGIPGPAIGFLQEALRWWDRWLKGIDTGVDREPQLRAWMQESVPPTPSYRYRPGRWVAEPTWPSSRITTETFRLAPGSLLPADETVEPTEQTIQSPLSVGLFAGKWCSYSATPDLPHDQREEDGGALVFDSDALVDDLEILGAPALELELSSAKPVAMVAVRLSDVARDDKATRVTYGLLNLTHRDGSAEPKPLDPGTRYRVRIELNHVAHVFPAGHHLRLAISTSYWPLAWPPPTSARLRLPLHAAALEVPVRPPRPEDEDLRPFPEPEGAARPQMTPLAETQHNWRVIRDLATDTSTLEVIKDEGRYRIEEIDLEVTEETREWYTSQDDDFTSLRGETYAVRGFRRGAWTVRTVTRTVLTASPDAFRIQADLDAYEGDHRVWCRTWDRTVPRDLL